MTTRFLIDDRGLITLEIASENEHDRSYSLRLAPREDDLIAATVTALDTNKSYRVALAPSGVVWCDCPDSFWRGRMRKRPCKHGKACLPFFQLLRPFMNQEAQEIADRLSAEFDPSEVKYRPGATSGNRALALAYVDARVIQDRLDDVLGVMGWQDTYTVLPEGAVVCRLRILIGGEWITKEDVGGQSDQPDEHDRVKAAFSDALKRAAVKFGIGRYLYRLPAKWVDYDPQKKQLKTGPSPARETAAPRTAPFPGARAAEPAARTAPFPGAVFNYIKDCERRLMSAGCAIRPGELDIQVARDVEGLTGDPRRWPESKLDAVKFSVLHFAVKLHLDRTGLDLSWLNERLSLANETNLVEYGTDELTEAARFLKAEPTWTKNGATA